MSSTRGGRPYRWLVAVCILSAMAQVLLWLIALGPILDDDRRARFLAATDPGSYLIPAACIFFHGTEGKDFVKAGGSPIPPFRGQDICWYSRAGFQQYFPELQGPIGPITVLGQTLAMGLNVFQQDDARTNLQHTTRRSLHIGLACLMLIAFCYYLARRRWRRLGSLPATGKWDWQRRESSFPKR